MSKRTVIVSGGMLEEDFVLPILKSEETEFVIGVDKGLEFLYKHEIKPDYIVGDFDSVSHELVDYYREELNVPIREFNPVKDASDTEIALRLCLGLNRKSSGFWEVQGIGSTICGQMYSACRLPWMRVRMQGSWTAIIRSVCSIRILR